MHVISRKKLRQFAAEHTDADGPLSKWYKAAEKAEWANFNEIRADFPHASLVGKFIVFNIGGHKYLLITEVYHKDQVILIRHVLTHKEYDKEHWKNSPDS